MSEDYIPTNKSALLEVIHAERARLETLLEGLTDQQMTAPEVEANWSIKDILAHLSAWERLATDRLQAAQSGSPLNFPPISDDAAVDTFNAEIYAAHKDQPLAEVLTEFQRAHQDFLAQIEALPEDRLPRKLGFAWSGKLTYQVLISSNSHWHDREHAAAIETWLETQG